MKVVVEANLCDGIGHSEAGWGWLPPGRTGRQDLHDEYGRHMATAICLPYEAVGFDGRIEQELRTLAGGAVQHDAPDTYVQLPADSCRRYVELGWGSTPGDTRKVCVQFDHADKCSTGEKKAGKKKKKKKGPSSLVPFWTNPNAAAEAEGIDKALQVRGRPPPLVHTGTSRPRRPSARTQRPTQNRNPACSLYWRPSRMRSQLWRRN